MAFETVKASGKNWGDYQKRDKPLADASNVTISRGLGKYGCSEHPAHDLDLTYAVNSSGADVDFTQNTAITGLRYYKILVCDGKKNEAAGLVDVTATTTPINIDTSALDASQTWQVTVFIADASTPIGCNCEDTFNFQISGVTADPTDTIDTAQTVGALSVAVDGNTVADGGSEALAGASVGDVVIADITITNTTASSIVNVTSVTVSGDGTFNNAGIVPFKVLDTDSISVWRVLIDTSTAGAKTASLVIVSDDAASPYNVDITCTVS